MLLFGQLITLGNIYSPRLRVKSLALIRPLDNINTPKFSPIKISYNLILDKPSSKK